MCREHALHDELIGAPIPHRQNGRAEQNARPRKLRMIHAAPQAQGLGRNRRAHSFHAAQRRKAEGRDAERAAEQNEHLHHVGVEHHAQPAPYGVCAGNEHNENRAGPEGHAHERFENNAPGGDGHRNFGEHIPHHRKPGQISARAGRIAALQKLGHGEDAAAQIKGRKQPGQQQQHQPGHNFKLRHRNAAAFFHRGGGGARQAHQVLGADVRGENGSADDEPAHIAARQKEIALAAAPAPPGRNCHPEDQREVERNHAPIQRVQAARAVHGRQPTAPAGAESTI